MKEVETPALSQLHIPYYSRQKRVVGAGEALTVPVL